MPLKNFQRRDTERTLVRGDAHAKESHKMSGVRNRIHHQSIVSLLQQLFVVRWWRLMDRAAVTCTLVCVVRSTIIHIYLLKNASFVAEQLAVWFIMREFVLATDGYSFVVHVK